MGFHTKYDRNSRLAVTFFEPSDDPTVANNLYRAWYAQYMGRGKVDRLHAAMEEALNSLTEEQINAVMNKASEDTAAQRERRYRRSTRRR
jgi:hypothetical protein